MNHLHLARELAVALLAGLWTRPELLRRADETFGKEYAWTGDLVDRVLSKFGSAHSPNYQPLARFLRQDREFFDRYYKHRPILAKRILTAAPMSRKPGVPSTWNVRHLATEGDICNWLELTSEKLAWLADVHGQERSRNNERLRNYVYRWFPKRSGGWRLLEIPKSLLKAIQRKILTEILEKIPPHAAARGFLKKVSVKNFVEPHTGRRVVLRMDLKDFFLSVQASRVHALFRTAGYPEQVARMLTGLCTNSVPSSALKLPSDYDRLPAHSEIVFRTPHLPQGAPTSPAFANLCAYRLDNRLAALAKKFGWNYTRYADDLLFSGRQLGQKFIEQFQIWAGAIAIEEGFKINMRKTRVMRRSVCQRAVGLVLNEKPNISRTDYDTLKATLHNCVKTGPEPQNRAKHSNFKAHLLGKISHVGQFNPQHAKRLGELFSRITWSQA